MHKLEHLILLLPATVAFVWVLVFIFIEFQNKWRKYTLTYFMISSVFSMILDFFFYTEQYIIFDHLYIYVVFFSLSQFPALYNYLVSLTTEGSNHIFTYLKHWIAPLILTVGVLYIQHSLLSNNERLYFVENILTGKVEIYGKYKFVFYADKLVKIVFILLSFFYFHLINTRVNDHEEYILDFFSNTDQISFKWFKVFKLSFFQAFVFCIIYQFFDRDFHQEHIWFSLVTFMVIAFFYGVVGYIGIKKVDLYKTYSQDNLHNSVLTQLSDKVVVLDKNKTKEIANSIDALITNRKLYLMQDLTIVDLSSATRISRDNILYVIKNHFKLNFNNYINQKRVNHAKQILSSNRIISKDALYKSCGFKTQAGFYKVFIDLTGESPAKFKNRVLLSDEVI